MNFENEITHASVFTGIGGFDLAAKWMGWRNVFMIEKNKFCIKVLNKNFPEADKFFKIEEFHGQEYIHSIDVLSGGDPCQPHSTFGKRRGASDPRYLWPQMRRVYNEVKPRIIINENVPGSINNGILDQKISDLEADGYTCWPPLVIPAGAAGALHIRYRVFLVAHSNAWRCKKCNSSDIAKEKEKRNAQNNAIGITEFWADARYADKSSILRMTHGIPRQLYRNQRIAALGNAVSPIVVYPIYQFIESLLKSSIS